MSSFNDLLKPTSVAPNQDYPSSSQWNALLAELRPQFANLRFQDPATPAVVALTDVPLLLNPYDEDGHFPPAPNNQLNQDIPSGSITVQRTVFSRVVGQPTGLMVKWGLEIAAVVSAGGGVKTVFFELYADGSPTGIIEEYSVRSGDLILKSDITLGTLPDGAAISLYAYTSPADAITLDFYVLQFSLEKVPLGVTDAILTSAPVF